MGAYGWSLHVVWLLHSMAAKGSQTPMCWSRPSVPGIQGRNCIAFYDTALPVIQHTLSVKTITSLPRLKGRGTSLYLLTGMCQDHTVDGYVGQEALLQSSQKNTTCCNPHFSHINSYSPYMQNTLILSLSLPYTLVCSPVAHYLYQVQL